MEVLKYFHYTSFKTSDNGGMKRLHIYCMCLSRWSQALLREYPRLWFSPLCLHSFLRRPYPVPWLYVPSMLWQLPHLYISSAKLLPNSRLMYPVAYSSFSPGCLIGNFKSTACSVSFLIIVHGTFILLVLRPKTWGFLSNALFQEVLQKFEGRFQNISRIWPPLYTSTSVTLYHLAWITVIASLFSSFNTCPSRVCS